MDSSTDRGFTIVEMIVTVLVAAMMVGIFYQLFVSIVQAGAAARKDAAAHDVVSALIKRYPTTYSVSGDVNCVADTEVTTTNGTSSEIGAYTETLSATCPYTSSPSITKITGVVTYNNGASSVTQAAYVN